MPRCGVAPGRDLVSPAPLVVALEDQLKPTSYRVAAERTWRVAAIPLYLLFARRTTPPRSSGSAGDAASRASPPGSPALLRAVVFDVPGVGERRQPTLELTRPLEHLNSRNRATVRLLLDDLVERADPVDRACSSMSGMLVLDTRRSTSRCAAARDVCRHHPRSSCHVIDEHASSETSRRYLARRPRCTPRRTPRPRRLHAPVNWRRRRGSRPTGRPWLRGTSGTRPVDGSDVIVPSRSASR